MKQRRLLLICFVAFFATTADAKNARNKNWEVQYY